MHRYRAIVNQKLVDEVLRWLQERGLYDPKDRELGDLNVADTLTEYEEALRGTPQAELRRHDAIMGAVASLAAAISLLERTPRAKKAAPSDRMFFRMLADYRKALDDVRAELRSPPSVAEAAEAEASPKP